MISPQYLAGVIDSDGSISISKRHHQRKNINYICMIQLTWIYNSKTKSVMEEIKETYGGSFYVGARGNGYDTKNNIVIKYCATGKAAEKLLKDINPHLKLKNKQAVNALSLRNLTSQYVGKHRPEDITNALEMLYINNKEENTKNDKD